MIFGAGESMAKSGKTLAARTDIERELDRMHEDARAAMSGLCANPGGPVQQDDAQGWNLMNCTFDSIAQVAYSLAEAMATERAKRRAKLAGEQ